MFNWLRRKSAPTNSQQATTFDAFMLRGNGAYGIVVAGTSRRQEALRLAVDAWQQQDQGTRRQRIEVVAGLVREPDNKADANAVAVYIAGRQVGYLKREDAAAYQPVLQHLARRKQLGACNAVIIGGRSDAPNYGVRLDLDEPDEAL